MTREELRGHCERQIQQFERVEKIKPVTPNDWKRYEEHKLILELLEQTDGDLISRQAVIDLLNRFIEVEQKQGTDVMNYGRERVNAYESVLWEIESDYLFPSMPSAENTAKWKPLDKEKEQYYMFGYICSKCGAPAKSPTKYCPNCGCRMDGGKPG